MVIHLILSYLIFESDEASRHTFQQFFDVFKMFFVRVALVAGELNQCAVNLDHRTEPHPCQRHIVRN